MADGDFWKGATCGLITGAVLMRWLDGGSRGARYRTLAPPPTAWSGRERVQERGGLRLRREEGSGDPSTLTAARTGANASFERRGGAPGGTQRPESLEMPGRPGQSIDPAVPVKLASRALPLRKEEAWGDESSPD